MVQKDNCRTVHVLCIKKPPIVCSKYIPIAYLPQSKCGWFFCTHTPIGVRTLSPYRVSSQRKTVMHHEIHALLIELVGHDVDRGEDIVPLHDRARLHDTHQPALLEDLG